MKLLLDEMYPPTLAEALRDKGHDVIAVSASADLAGSDDATILEAATADGRCLVTENVRDLNEAAPDMETYRGDWASQNPDMSPCRGLGSHPAARPSLAEVALALAAQDGSALADQPEIIARAAAEIAARHPDADADDVLLWAEAQQALSA